VGVRLWPDFCEQTTKPFIQLGDGESLLQKAFLSDSQLSKVNMLHHRIQHGIMGHGSAKVTNGHFTLTINTNEPTE